MVSCLVRSSPERAVRVRALAEDTVLCSWARHLTLTVSLSTKEYKWVPANCWGKPNKLRCNDLRWNSIPSRGSKYTSSRFMLHKPRISYGSYDPVGSKASLTTFFPAQWRAWFANQPGQKLWRCVTVPLRSRLWKSMLLPSDL